jgi:molybdopterin converting factor small subunit
MNVEVKLFAVAKQLVGDTAIELDVREGTTIGDLRSRLAAEYPDLAPLLPHVLFAVGSQYVGDSHAIVDATPIACIPPVSGG